VRAGDLSSSLGDRPRLLRSEKSVARRCAVVRDCSANPGRSPALSYIWP
jgi:hypothetical protein